MAIALSRTDRVLAAVQASLERQRAALDQSCRVQRVDIIVHFDARTGAPHAAEVRVGTRIAVQPVDE